MGFPGGSDSKEFVCNTRDPGSIPGSRRSPGEFHERGSLMGHGVTKGQTQLRQLTHNPGNRIFKLRH